MWTACATPTRRPWTWCSRCSAARSTRTWWPPLNRLGGQAIGLCGMDGGTVPGREAGREVRPGGRDHQRGPAAWSEDALTDRLYPGGVHRGPGRGRRHRLQHQRRHCRRQAGGGPGGGKAHPSHRRAGPAAGPQRTRSTLISVVRACPRCPGLVQDGIIQGRHDPQDGVLCGGGPRAAWSAPTFWTGASPTPSSSRCSPTRASAP